MIKPFKVSISDQVLKDIYKKVKDYPWHEEPNDSDWQYGTNLNYMKKISKYWTSEFDWRKLETKINNFSNFKTTIDDIELHYIYKKGSGKNSIPLLLCHGWPGSIVEFLNIIEKLTNPEKFGGKEEDSFDVIVPSLPGFGFSSRPSRPIGPRKMATIFNSLMTNVLGYKKYISQGGDFGGTICTWLAYDFPKNLLGIHINILITRHPDGPQTEEEKQWQERFKKEQRIEDGYRTQQATKPQTLSYAMMDSPVGVAAWIIEKIHGWSDIKNGDIESVYSKDILLSNIMIYLVTKTFNTASWIYYGRREEGGRALPKDHLPLTVPTAIAKFPKEYLEWAPKSYVERIYNVQQWTEMPTGGHFAAMEEPDLLVKDIISFAKILS
ncbi:MAG: epoxide hydrolase [Pelagibacteraceae bacterium TMED233]|nr:epoxide hydrolase [Candidatus Pelagibacter sp.]RPG06632.1 MAG: epoxide hydrolase [Pelagibacteraceae bacterium TMED233]